MESLKSITEALQLGEYRASLDLKEAYLHVPFLPIHRLYLRFCVADQHFQYRALPFGLSTPPRVFTKVLVNIVAHLWMKGIHIHPYLDNLLVCSHSKEQCLIDLRLKMQCLQTYGFVVNVEKSVLVLSQTHTSGDGDRYLMQFIVPYTKKDSNDTSHSRTGDQGAADQPHGSSKINGPLDCQHGRYSMGLFSHMTTTVLPAPTSVSNCTEDGYFSTCPPGSQDQFTVVDKGLQSASGKEIWDAARGQIFTDASLLGWGAMVNNLPIQGRWSPEETQLPINVLELKTIHLALLRFRSLVQNCHVLVRMDNLAAKAYLNNQGGLRSKTLHSVAHKLLIWAELHLASIRAEHMKGQDNVQVDWLS